MRYLSGKKVILWNPLSRRYRRGIIRFKIGRIRFKIGRIR